LVKNKHTDNNSPETIENKRDTETKNQIAKLIEDQLGMNDLECYSSSFLRSCIRRFYQMINEFMV